MKILKSVLIVTALLFLSLLPVSAQPGDPGGDPDQPVPITGIEWLLAAGGAFGGYKAVRKRLKG